MGRFILFRALGAIGVLVALVTIVFLLQAVVPGDPVRASVGANASDEVVARERARLGLDKPVPVQYVAYLGQAARGEFGESLRTGRGVREDIGAFAPATLELAAFSIVLATAGGLLIGVLAVTASRLAAPARLLFVGGASVPSFLLALSLIYVFYFRLGWLPLSGRTGVGSALEGPTGILLLDALLHLRLDVFLDGLRHLLMPALSLALVPAVAIGRVLRSSLLEVYRADYIRTLAAKGLAPWRILWGHALRNALSAPLTMLGLQTGLLLGGVVIVETIFSWPGLGLYMNQSIQFGDLRAIAGVTLVVGASYVAINTLVDIAQAGADPRIRL
ncbi:MAG: ABC transporter permease [Actinomycetota bacterium]|jgi:peptide/nickel transport system permease protein|nr:ABC transporter permease [Actinomycetota bacterium]